MPKAKTEGLATGFKLIKASSIDAKERNDCAVVAITAATGLPYSHVHGVLSALGRKPRRGTNTWDIRSAMRVLGYDTVELDMRPNFINRYPSPHFNLRHVTTHHPERFNDVWRDGHNYLFLTDRHILAVNNGVNMDHTRGRAVRVNQVWRVEKKPDHRVLTDTLAGSPNLVIPGVTP